MTVLPVQLAPQGRDDIRGEVAEGAGVSTAPDVLDMLAALDAAIADARNGEFLWRRRFGTSVSFWSLQVRGLRRARAIVAAGAPCAACGHRVLPIDPVGAAGAPSPGAVTAHPADGAALTPPPLGVGAADIRGAR